MNKIKHSGTVSKVVRNKVYVRILQSSACSACKVAHHCNAAETKEKIIEISHTHANIFSPGEQVIVTANTSVGFRASLYGYLLPLLLMVLMLVLMLYFTKSEDIAALSALAILGPYYMVLYLSRNKINDKLNFGVEKY